MSGFKRATLVVTGEGATKQVAPIPASIREHSPGGKGHNQKSHGRRKGKKVSVLARAVAEDFEARYTSPDRFHEVEGGRLIAPDGEVLWEKMDGQSSRLDGVPSSASAKDGVFTHYHPPTAVTAEGLGNVTRGAISQPPSVSDISYAMYNNLSEVRVIGLDKGRAVTFRLTRPKKGWPGERRVEKSFYSQVDAFVSKSPAKNYKGDLARYSFNVQDAAWKALSKKYGIGYEVTYAKD